MSGPGGLKEVATMAWPLAIGMLSYTFMGVTDTLLMGRVGTTALAGVGLATTCVWLCLAFFRGVVTGTQSVVAAADGAGDGGRIRSAASTGAVLGLSAGIMAGLIVAWVMAPLVPLVSGEAEVGATAQRYLSVRCFGLPFALLAFGLESTLQGLGDTRARMWVSVAGNALNVVLDLILIFGVGPVPAFGEAGAAAATACSSALMAVLYSIRYVRRVRPLARPSWAVLKNILSLGWPAGMQGLIEVGAWTLVSVVVAQVGSVHLAAHQIALNVVSVSFLPGYGISEGGAVLVGRYLGAGQPGTADTALRSARRLALWVMAAFGVIFLVGGRWLAQAFNNDPAVVEVTASLLMLAALFQLADAVAMVHLCALRGAGDTRFTLILSSAASWGLTVPLTLGLGLGLGWGAVGLWLGLTAEIAALAGVTWWRVNGLASGRIGRLDLLLGEGSS